MLSFDRVFKTLILFLIYYFPFDFFCKMFIQKLTGIDISILKEIFILTAIILSQYRSKWVFQFSGLHLIALLLYVGLCIVYLMVNLSSAGISGIRDAVLPIVILYLVNGSEELRNLVIRHLLAVLLIVCVGGLIEYFGLHIFISNVKGVIEEIRNNGVIIYKTSSFTKLGLLRMSGFSTGPNDFGMIVSLLLFLNISLQKNKSLMSKTIIGLGIFCLIMSISRAGIVFLILSITLFNYRVIFRYLLQAKTMLLLAFLLLLVIFTLYQVVDHEKLNQYKDLYALSVKLEDNSSSNRVEQVKGGIALLFSNPIGHGLGSTDFRFGNDGSIIFYESSWINMTYEIGFLIYIYFFLLLAFPKANRMYFVFLLTHLTIGFFSINPTGTSYQLFAFTVLSILILERGKLSRDVAVDKTGNSTGWIKTKNNGSSMDGA